MKLNFSNSKNRGLGGIMLIECLVYISVFAILLGVGTGAFYVFWDNSTVLRETTDDITGALRAGEIWRTDVRGASGKIQTENSSDGVLVAIPQSGGEIFYRLSGDTLWRRTTAANYWTPVLHHIRNSQMQMDDRDGIQAWRWELKLIPRRAQEKMPLEFSFEAVAPLQS